VSAAPEGKEEIGMHQSAQCDVTVVSPASLRSGVLGLCALLLLLFAGYVQGQDVIDFESDRWVQVNAQVVDFLGRKCLIGRAYLKDVEFENGVIEVDIAFPDTDRRSYPGIFFRVQSPTDYEHFYIRPHRAFRYPDALQYAPTINGIGGWQLYSGDGFTAEAELPENEWIHVRLEVMGRRARVFLGETDAPALVINDLKHGASMGTISLDVQADGSAYFSNFTYRVDDGLVFGPEPKADVPPGIINEWELSQPFRITDLDLELHPADQDLGDLKWQSVTSEPLGLVDVARYYGRLGRGPDCIFARAAISSDRPQTRQYQFGYSDWIGVFLNGQILFSANSAYRQRDPSFLGIIGMNDAIYLPLEQGDNELLFTIAESFGGWGFMCQDAEATYEYEGVVKVWETGPDFAIPECVVYDAESGALFVSNYDAYNPSNNQGRQHISKLKPDGTVESLEWVGGLNNPTGMAVHKGRLYVVERADVAEIDIGSAAIITRHPIPEPGFPNDIAIDASGTMYVSDSRKDVIYRSGPDGFEEWLGGYEVDDPNGICADRGKLIWGNNADKRLKIVDAATGEITVLAELTEGVIDGLTVGGDGDYLVSHWQGRIYRVRPSGETVKLLDISVPGPNCADFAYVAESELLVIPAFTGNKVIAYTIPE
jgi:sugar lactone lactonase YvrE